MLDLGSMLIIVIMWLGVPSCILITWHIMCCIESNKRIERINKAFRAHSREMEELISLIHNLKL